MYGSISWSNASKTFLNQILILQKRVLRLIHFAQAREHTIPIDRLVHSLRPRMRSSAAQKKIHIHIIFTVGKKSHFRLIFFLCWNRSLESSLVTRAAISVSCQYSDSMVSQDNEWISFSSVSVLSLEPDRKSCSSDDKELLIPCKVHQWHSQLIRAAKIEKVLTFWNYRRQFLIRSVLFLEINSNWWINVLFHTF